MNPKPKKPDGIDKLQAKVSALSLLSGLVSRTARRTTTVRLPGELGADEEAGSVSFVPLRGQEAQDCELAAQEHLLLKRHLPEFLLPQEIGQTMMNDEIVTQILARVMRAPNNLTQRFADNASEVRAMLDVDQRAAIYKEFLAFMESISPFHKLSLEEIAEVMADVGKTTAHTEAVRNSLTYYDSGTLRNIIILLWNEVTTLRKKVSSATSSQSSTNT